MRVILMNIAMAERTLQKLGSPNGITVQKSDGLPSPERSGSPELNTRSSQWKREHIAYASKDDAHQMDDWPEPAHNNRKSEDVLVRYKDTRGSKGLSTRMDPHAWSDLPTDTDDEDADNATSPVWNGAHDAGFSPKAELDISIQQLKTTVPRDLGCIKTQLEFINIQCFASGDRWETVAVDVADTTSDAEKESGGVVSKLPTPAVASSQNGLKSPCHEGERVEFSGPESRVPTLRNVPAGRLSTSQKVLDEQASMKMSHRYYTSGLDSTRRSSIPSGKEDINMKHGDRRKRTEADYKSKPEAELAESGCTSDDSDCSDAEEYGKSHEGAEESFREMILQKYLVMAPGKAKKMVTKQQKEGRSCKSQAPTGEPRKSNGNKNVLHSISPSRRQRFQLRKSPKKSGAPHTETRPSVSQPAEALEANLRAAAEARASPREEEEESQTGKTSSGLVALLRKSWSTGDLHHSKSLGDIGALKGHALTHREFTEQEKRTVDVAKVSLSDNASQASVESRCLNTIVVQREVKKSPQHTSDQGQNNCANDFCIRSVEVSTTVTAELISDEGVSCGCLNSPSVLSKTQPSSGEAMEGAECYQWQGEQGLSALALLHGPADSTSTDDPSVHPFMGMPAGTHWIHENPMAKEQVQLHSKGAEESSDGGSPHRAKYNDNGKGAAESESRNGFSKPKSLVKKVTAVVRGDDQVLPDVSLAGQPASHTLLELQHEVEFSRYHVADERRQQVRKQPTTPEQCWGTEKLAQQKKGFWDSSQELQKEKQNLIKRLQELEAHHPCNRLKAMSGTITEEDAKKLRQEILEQEALIRGYQVENEKAVAKLKEVQLEAKQKLQEMAEEKAHLASQLINRQMLGYGTTVDSASLHEKLQGALSRETALRNDLDKMRDSYMELEKRGKREESSRVKDLELKLTSLQETLEAERQSHAQMEGRKQAMIQQEELIASLQETISDQASKIRSLTSRLEAGEGQEKKEAQLQIETLQNQVKRLEASLRASKKETGLHALQVAAKSGMEENETFRRLQAELMAVQRNALQRDEETNRIIHHLKLENDKIKHESATRIRNLNHQIQTQAKHGHSISETELSAVNRVKDLEKQVANLRIHYSTKVKELTHKLEEANKPVEANIGRTKTDNMGPPSRVPTTRLQPAQGKALREAKERIALQEDVLSQKDRTIKSLQKQIQEMQTNGAGPACNITPVVPNIEGQRRAKPAVREVQHCSSSRSGNRSPMDSPNKGTTCTHNAGSANGDEVADEVAMLRRELQKSELTREVLQKTCNESVEKTVLLTLQHQQALQLQQIRQSQMNNHHQHRRIGSECQGTHTSTFAGWADRRSGLEGVNWLSERSSLEMANRALESRLKVMSEDLEEANTMCQQSPRMTQIMNLKKKVAEMEARQQQKEMEWHKVLDETKQTSSMEQDYAEQKWREALDSKSMEVEKIRLELNTILEAAMAMQHAQLQMNHH